MSIIIEESEEPDIVLYGDNKKAFQSRDRYVILVGPASTGKSWALCLKLHMYCMLYPGVKCLMARKTLPALRNSSVKTFKEVLIKTNMDGQVRVLGETRPTHFIYPYKESERDGVIYKGTSEITLSQIDMKGKALGAEYDMIYIVQPDTEELTLDEFLLTASRARLANAPYRQIIADPNPAHDKHWLLENAISKDNPKGKWEFFNSVHKDNPVLYNHEKNEWTDRGKEYIKSLEDLPETRKESQLYGRWFSNAGMAFAEYWDSNKHVLNLASSDAIALGISVQDKDGEYENAVPQLWEHYLAIDWGFKDPFVALLIAKHPELDKYIVHKHIYITNKDINYVSNLTASMVKGYNIKAIVADRGPSDAMVMESVLGIPITAARKGAGSIKDSMNICISELNSDRWKFLNTQESLFHEPDENIISRNGLMGYEEIYNLKKNEKTGNIASHQDDHYYDALKYFMRYLVDINHLSHRKDTVLFI